jgi:succinate-acetate transporter protein
LNEKTSANAGAVGLAGFSGTTLLLQFHNFGFAAFSTYCAFWMALGGILLGTHFGILHPTTADTGWFLVMFTLITAVFLIGAIRVSRAHSVLFFTLLFGFVFLDVSHLAGPATSFFTIAPAVDLTICGLTAWHIMAHIVLTPLNVRIPLGKPLVG